MEIKSYLFFISIHIVEVVKELARNEKVSFKSFVYRPGVEKPIRNYKLIDGISSERHGLTIFENESTMESLIRLFLKINQ